MRRLQESLSYSWNHFSRYQQATTDVVSCNVARHQREEWRQCYELQRALGLKSYQTAWTWLHKIRRAMIRPGWDHLSGMFEVDETFVGGEEIAVRGRLAETNHWWSSLLKLMFNGIGRIRRRCIPDASSESLLPFIENVIEPGSIVRTDGWSGYSSFPISATDMK